MVPLKDIVMFAVVIHKFCQADCFKSYLVFGCQIVAYHQRVNIGLVLLPKRCKVNEW